MALGLFYLGQLGHALYMGWTTDPPVCSVSTATVLPSPLCPGLEWDQHSRFLLSLPGAYLSYPLEIGLYARAITTFANPQFVLIILVHVFGWGYLIWRLKRRARS